jgi:HD domain
MNDILALPRGPLTDASLALVRSTERQPIVDHSIRTFLFARLVAEHEGCLDDAAYDEDLLFAATVMHDLGLGDHAQGQGRFEVEGADLAASVLRAHGVSETDVDRVWEAIALHSSIGIADRRGLLTYLTYKGVFVDVGLLADAIAERLRDEVLSALPRPPGDSYLRKAIVEHGTRSEAAAPPGSLAAFLMLAQQVEAGTRPADADRSGEIGATRTAGRVR